MESLTASWASIRSAAAEPTPVPPRLVPRVLSRINAERRAGSGQLELVGERGTLRIGARVVVGVARAAAATVPGVRVRTGTFEGTTSEGARLTLDLALHHDSALADTELRTRRKVDEDLRRMLGTPPPIVDIRIVDVW
jgi:hypothetical protein